MATTVIDMSKNKKYNMTKEDGTPIKVVFMGANWDMNRFSNEANADLDVQLMKNDSNHRVKYPNDIVNYKTWRDYGASAYPWCQFSGDNTTGNDSDGGNTFNGKHYDEYFIIDYDKFPDDNSELTLCLTIFRAVQRMQNFGMVSNASIDIYDYENPTTCWKYNLTDNENFENLNAVEIGRLFRGANGFRFQALGSGYVGGMTELFKNFGLDIDEGRD